tara:strand:+ start:1954 stop:2517 length:564 start_codon:yes stop_codon:yes gene_type:complete
MAVGYSRPEYNFREEINRNFADTIPPERMPMGSIIQVRHHAHLTNGQYVSTGSSFVDVTGMFVKIKPTLPSSRILIHIMINSIYGNLGGVGGSSNYHFFRVVKQVNNRTDNCNAMGGKIDAEIQRQHNQGEHSGRFYQVFDFPKSTMELTYRLQASEQGNMDLLFNDTGSTSSMTAYEIRSTGDERE